MKKKLRLKNWVKYLILGIIDLIFIINLPNILKDTESINNYRFNILIIMIFLIINIIFIGIIENKKGVK